MKWWKRLKMSTVIFSLCRSTDYAQHFVCVPVSAQLKSPGSNPGTTMDPWCFQRAPSPAHRSQQGMSEDIPCPASTPLHDPHSYTLSWVPALQKALGLLTATSSTCGFLFYLFLSCGRYLERDPQARWAGWTWCRMFIHMHWNSYTYTFKTAVNQEMSHEMCKRQHINNLFYSLN